MGFFQRLVGKVREMFFTLNSSDVQKAFGVELISSTEMNNALKRWNAISTGSPSWLDEDIRTINMAKFICDVRAKLITLDIGIALDGSPRAEFIQTVADDLIKRLPDQIANACRLGGLCLRWNGKSWDFMLPGDFGITEQDDNGEITGIIFREQKSQGNNRYTRLEYHRFENGLYKVTNKAFRNVNAGSKAFLGNQVPLSTVHAWEHLQDEVTINNLEYPLFAFFRIPGANTVDTESPLGVSVFADAETELRSIDIAFSRKDTEIEDSQHVTFVGQAVIQGAKNKGTKLPRYIKGLGVGVNDADVAAIKEHVPTLLTEDRIKDINFDLSLAGVKCGFSEGVFVMDGQTGMITATQVESDDRDTIQTIKTDRDALKSAIDRALYGVDVMATLYNLAPIGVYECNYNFGDITYSYEEDKAKWYAYAQTGKIPFWYYLVKFEGLSEEDAKALVEEASIANNMELGLFGSPTPQSTGGGKSAENKQKKNQESK